VNNIIYSVVFNGSEYEVWADDRYVYSTRFWFRESAERFIFDIEEGYELFNEEDWIAHSTSSTWSLL
jgi:hypothetical protein